MATLDFLSPYELTFGLNPGSGNIATPYAFWNLLIPDLQRMGVKKVRFQLSLDSIEVPQGTFNLAALDDAVSHLNAANIVMTFPFRNAPSWYNGAFVQNATDEPFIFPDPTSFANVCTTIATRYDGNHGHGKIDRYEVGNEDGDIHNTPPAFTFNLNQALTNGLNYATIAVQAVPNAMLPNAIAQFGTWNGSGQKFQLPNGCNQGDTSLTIQQVGTGTFTANQNYSNGSPINVQYTGLQSSTSPYWDGTGGVLGSNKPKPARDPQFWLPIQKAAYQAIKAVSNVPVGMNALWWLQPKGGGVYNQPLSQFATYLDFYYRNGGKGFFDYVNFHYYSNGVDPTVGDAQTITIGAAIQELAQIMGNWGDSGTKIKITEYGYQVPTDAATEAIRSARFKAIQDAARLSGVVDEIAFFSLNYTVPTPSQSSLVQNNGSGYTYGQTFTDLQQYIATYPYWNQAPPAQNIPGGGGATITPAGIGSSGGYSSIQLKGPSTFSKIRKAVPSRGAMMNKINDASEDSLETFKSAEQAVINHVEPLVTTARWEVHNTVQRLRRFLGL